MVKVQSHECVAGLQHSEQYGSIGLCSRVRLNIGILCTEDFLYALDGKVLYDIYHLATAIVTFARESLSILVGKVRTHSVHYLFTHKVLGSNQLHTFQLTLMFSFDQVENLLVFFH